MILNNNKVIINIMKVTTLPRPKRKPHKNQQATLNYYIRWFTGIKAGPLTPKTLQDPTRD